jgi:hypothetical protein
MIVQAQYREHISYSVERAVEGTMAAINASLARD